MLACKQALQLESHVRHIFSKRSEPQSSRGQLRLPLAPSFETPDWRAGLQATSLSCACLLPFLSLSHPIIGNFIFYFFIFLLFFLVASYPTYHSFYFKWSCLNLGSKSCGKYVWSVKDKSDLEAAIKSVKLS